MERRGEGGEGAKASAVFKFQLLLKMSELHKQLAAIKPAPEKTTIQRQIDATDKKIDDLVYELYGLGEEERRVVEGEVDNG